MGSLTSRDDNPVLQVGMMGSEWQFFIYFICPSDMEPRPYKKVRRPTVFSACYSRLLENEFLQYVAGGQRKKCAHCLSFPRLNCSSILEVGKERACLLDSTHTQSSIVAQIKCWDLKSTAVYEIQCVIFQTQLQAMQSLCLADHIRGKVQSPPEMWCTVNRLQCRESCSQGLR